MRPVLSRSFASAIYHHISSCSAGFFNFFHILTEKMLISTGKTNDRSFVSLHNAFVNISFEPKENICRKPII